jgi:phosphate transport system substrate-binding protein
MSRKTVVAVAALVLGLAAPVQAQVKVDPKLPEYKPVGGLSGNLTSVGSDTMNDLMALWAEGFHKVYPNVQVAAEGKGGATAAAALINGTAQFGPMSRPMRQAEIDKFEAKFGYKPTALPTSIDMLAVYVHKDNPIKSLTLEQIDAIFSKTRKADYTKDIKTWGDLGLAGEWADKPISLYGHNSASRTYGFLREHVLLSGDYKDSVREQPNSLVVPGVAADKFGMGYSGVGNKTAHVRAVPLAKSAKTDPSAPEPENAYTGKYPLARNQLIYLNYKPNTELDPLRREFIRYVFSKQGQQDVIMAGYVPITAPMAERALKTVGLALE